MPIAIITVDKLIDGLTAGRPITTMATIMTSRILEVNQDYYKQRSAQPVLK